MPRLALPAPAYAAPAVADDTDLAALGEPGPPLAPADAGIGGQGVSQSEIDGLFENILDEEPGESAEDGA